MKNHILIVEDDEAIREGVRILLEGEGYTVQEAEDGFQCLKKAFSRNRSDYTGYYDAWYGRI